MRFLKQFFIKNQPQAAPQVSKAPPALCEQAARGFEDVYHSQRPEQLPWFWRDLDPDFVSTLQQLGLTQGSVVDLGGGSGTQAIAMAKLGFTATSTDFSAAALEGGREFARQANVQVNFLLDDVTNSRLTTKFDLVFDRGCYHIIAPARRADYLRTVLRCLAPGGWFLLKCFSSDEPARPGPFRFSESEIRDFFGTSLDIVELRKTEFPGAREIFPKALFALMRHRPPDA